MLILHTLRNSTKSMFFRAPAMLAAKKLSGRIYAVKAGPAQRNVTGHPAKILNSEITKGICSNNFSNFLCGVL